MGGSSEERQLGEWTHQEWADSLQRQVNTLRKESWEKVRYGDVVGSSVEGLLTFTKSDPLPLGRLGERPTQDWRRSPVMWGPHIPASVQTYGLKR